MSGIVYWRFKSAAPGPWQFGFASPGPKGLVRMGLYNGDLNSGPLVDPSEIETR